MALGEATFPFEALRQSQLDEVPAALESMRLGRRIPGKQAVKIR